MKVLFVPWRNGGLSHLIPLVALHRMLRARSVETAFLLSDDWPKKLGEKNRILQQLDIPVLPIDYCNLIRSELRAYREFVPDVVVDDCSLTTGYASKRYGMPRVSIRRTGSFPFERPRNAAHRHSMPLAVEQLPDMRPYGFQRPSSISLPDLFAGDLNIVPGVPSIEALPDEIQGDPSYVFSGPLVVEDVLICDPGIGSADTSHVDVRDFGPLDRFFAENRGRTSVYVTHGLIATPPAEIVQCMRYLLERDCAIVTSIRSESLALRGGSRYFYAPYLPLGYVCDRVALAIHHCGNATYHYPILSGVPSITVGTACYDRENIAARLEELGVSRHLPSPVECTEFKACFVEAFEECFEGSGEVYAKRKERCGRLREEIEQTVGSFDLHEALAALVKGRLRPAQASGGGAGGSP
ncbi:MAG TPA: hypothetical protein VGR37_10775 [Longimicrobiaceae bacterium]|nr:hypothetical protein [Longimicrobiaceae bacterium]